MYNLKHALIITDHYDHYTVIISDYDTFELIFRSLSYEN